MNGDSVVRREHGREVVDALLEPPMKRAKKKRSKGFSLDRHLSDFFVDRAQTLPKNPFGNQFVIVISILLKSFTFFIICCYYFILYI